MRSDELRVFMDFRKLLDADNRGHLFANWQRALQFRGVSLETSMTFWAKMRKKDKMIYRNGCYGASVTLLMIVITRCSTERPPFYLGKKTRTMELSGGTTRQRWLHLHGIADMNVFLTNLIASHTDHSPILLNTEPQNIRISAWAFRFENNWLHEWDLPEVVARNWTSNGNIDVITTSEKQRPRINCKCWESERKVIKHTDTIWNFLETTS